MMIMIVYSCIFVIAIDSLVSKKLVREDRQCAAAGSRKAEPQTPETREAFEHREHRTHSKSQDIGTSKLGEPTTQFGGWSNNPRFIISLEIDKQLHVSNTPYLVGESFSVEM